MDECPMPTTENVGRGSERSEAPCSPPEMYARVRSEAMPVLAYQSILTSVSTPIATRRT